MNCVDYYSGGDKPYLISGADDRLIKIWDYQVKRVIIHGRISMLNLISQIISQMKMGKVGRRMSDLTIAV